MPNTTIAICGSAADTMDAAVIERLKKLGTETARRGLVMLTGAGPGYPYEAAKAHRAAGGLVLGISPANDHIDHIKNHHYPVDAYSVLTYTGFGISGRNVVLVRSADAAIYVAGGAGTANEFIIGYDEGKPLGILAQSGGVSAELKNLSRHFYRKPRHVNVVIEESDPIRLLDQLLPHIPKVSSVNLT